MGESFRVDILHNKTEQPNAKSAHPRISTGHVEREAHVKVILGRSGMHNGLPNESVYISGVHKVTPHKKYYGKKSDLSHVSIFDSIAYVHIPDEKRQKLDPKSEKCILVGYSLEQKGTNASILLLERFS